MSDNDNRKEKLENLSDSEGEFYDAAQIEDDEQEEECIQKKLLKKLEKFENDTSDNDDFNSITTNSSLDTNINSKPQVKSVNSKFQNINLNSDQVEEEKEKFVPLHERLNKKTGEDSEDEKSEPVTKKTEDDPYYIDESVLQAQDQDLNDEEKEEKLNESQKLKQLGNDEFKNEDYLKALDFYTQALRICPLKFPKERSVFYSNRSACYLKLKQNENCIAECAKSINLDATFLKPLLRRAECSQLIDKLEDALEDYKKLAELEPRTLVTLTNAMNWKKKSKFEMKS